MFRSLLVTLRWPPLSDTSKVTQRPSGGWLTSKREAVTQSPSLLR
jgi:hypothetical protein